MSKLNSCLLPLPTQPRTVQRHHSASDLHTVTIALGQNIMLLDQILVNTVGRYLCEFLQTTKLWAGWRHALTVFGEQQWRHYYQPYCSTVCDDVISYWRRPRRASRYHPSTVHEFNVLVAQQRRCELACDKLARPPTFSLSVTKQRSRDITRCVQPVNRSTDQSKCL